MASDPRPTIWSIPRPPADHPYDAWATGGDLEPGTLLTAYRAGLFPMRADGRIVWCSPVQRAVLPVVGFRPSRSLRRDARGYEIRVDTAFAEVVRGCADPRRPGGWIDDELAAAYAALHDLGAAHSVEAWDDEGLAGGVFGVACGGLFSAESKFHRRTGASKAALLGLIRLLEDAGGDRLLDVQWLTPHLASLGAQTITREQYHRRLDEALQLSDAF